MPDHLFDDREMLEREVGSFIERLEAAGDAQSILDIFDVRGADQIRLPSMDLSELQWIYDEYVKEEP